MRLVLIAALFASSASAADIVLTKSQFIEGFKKSLPDSFCADKSYFRQCFEITKEKCAKAVTEASTACIAPLETGIPEKLTKPTEGQAWGEKFGSCVGEKFEAEQPKKKTAPADCNDLAKWK